MNAEQRERHAKIVDLWSQHGGGYSTVFGGGIKAALIPVDQLYEFADALIAAERESIAASLDGLMDIIGNIRGCDAANCQALLRAEIAAIRARSTPTAERKG